MATSLTFSYHRRLVPTRRLTTPRLLRAALALAAPLLVSCIEPASAPLDSPATPDAAPPSSLPLPADAAPPPASGASAPPPTTPDASAPRDAPVDRPTDRATPAPRDRRVTLIHGMGMESEPATAAMLAILRDLQASDGIVVEPVVDALTTAPSLRDRALIIISPTAGALNGNLDRSIGELPVPLIISLPFFGTELGYAISDDGFDRTLTLASPAYPLSAGLSGAVNVYPVTATLHCATLTGADAIAIAWIRDDRTKPCIYAYETGGQMRRGLAAARRVSFFWSAGNDATPEGKALFRAAVRWALVAL
jgi:hypothetical protein